MAVMNNCTVTIKNLVNDAYSLGAVTTNPRAATALDIQAGLSNLAIEAAPDVNAPVPALPLAVIHYLFHDFFAMAHQSGLYNRQIRLWEMFSRVSAAQIQQVERGFFSRSTIPVYEIIFKTSVGQNPVCALVIDESIRSLDGFKNQTDAGKIYIELLRDFLLKVIKIQARLGANGVKGIFVVTPEPLAPGLLAFVEKSTGAIDPVSRAESIMPAPVSAHINLLTYSQLEPVAPDASESGYRITLQYPNISRRQG